MPGLGLVSQSVRWAALGVEGIEVAVGVKVAVGGAAGLEIAVAGEELKVAAVGGVVERRRRSCVRNSRRGGDPSPHSPVPPMNTQPILRSGINMAGLLSQVDRRLPIDLNIMYIYTDNPS